MSGLEVDANSEVIEGLHSPHQAKVAVVIVAYRIPGEHWGVVLLARAIAAIQTGAPVIHKWKLCHKVMKQHWERVYSNTTSQDDQARDST